MEAAPIDVAALYEVVASDAAAVSRAAPSAVCLSSSGSPKVGYYLQTLRPWKTTR